MSLIFFSIQLLIEWLLGFLFVANGYNYNGNQGSNDSLNDIVLGVFAYSILPIKLITILPYFILFFLFNIPNKLVNFSSTNSSILNFFLSVVLLLLTTFYMEFQGEHFRFILNNTIIASFIIIALNIAGNILKKNAHKQRK